MSIGVLEGYSQKLTYHTVVNWDQAEVNSSFQEEPDRHLPCGHITSETPSIGDEDILLADGPPMNSPSISTPPQMTSEYYLQWQGNVENMNYQGNGLFAYNQVNSTPLRLIRGGDSSPDSQENISDMKYWGNCFQTNEQLLSTPLKLAESEDTSIGCQKNETNIKSVSECELVSVIGDLDDPGGNLEDIAILDISDISIGSIPLLEKTPWIINDVTPNLSQDTIADDSENLHNPGAEGRTSIQNLLHEAGYTSLEIEYMSSNSKQKWDDGNYGGSRPHTQVFFPRENFHI